MSINNIFLNRNICRKQNRDGYSYFEYITLDGSSLMIAEKDQSKEHDLDMRFSWRQFAYNFRADDGVLHIFNPRSLNPIVIVVGVFGISPRLAAGEQIAIFCILLNFLLASNTITPSLVLFRVSSLNLYYISLINQQHKKCQKVGRDCDTHEYKELSHLNSV
uniref:Uncharacterized protein n=1 Tax=Glossina austeni TaxID=7395 RepID=A0A1A9V138_GLOAU